MSKESKFWVTTNKIGYDKNGRLIQKEIQKQAVQVGDDVQCVATGLYRWEPLPVISLGAMQGIEAPKPVGFIREA